MTVDPAHRLSVGAKAILEAAWIEDMGYCRPNPRVYPHQWLWDSCFHSIAWASLGDSRCLRELGSVFLAQLGDGCVPHIRYDGESDTRRGPLSYASSYTQPPIYAHAACFLQKRNFVLPREDVRKIAWGLDYLWRQRRSADGLIVIFHPWESGADDSPRWDDWLGSEYSRFVCTLVDLDLVSETHYNSFGSAVSSQRFQCAPAAFNALTAHAFREFGHLTGESVWMERSTMIADAVDAALWNRNESLWNDLPLVGGGASATIPTLDGVMPALVTSNSSYAEAALSQLADSARFAAPYGLAYTARTHPSFDPEAYWRGPAWPQMNYLVWLAAQRWDGRLAHEIARKSVDAALVSGFAEYWNPLSGAGLGAIPQTWATIAMAYGQSGGDDPEGR